MMYSHDSPHPSTRISVPPSQTPNLPIMKYFIDMSGNHQIVLMLYYYTSSASLECFSMISGDPAINSRSLEQTYPVGSMTIQLFS